MLGVGVVTAVVAMQRTATECCPSHAPPHDESRRRSLASSRSSPPVTVPTPRAGRPVPQGYKAGAMHEVHDAIEAEFIAIFDADFLPLPDFLLRTIPVFQDKNVGFVQGRWTYENADESLFCRHATPELGTTGAREGCTVCPARRVPCEHTAAQLAATTHSRPLPCLLLLPGTRRSA